MNIDDASTRTEVGPTWRRKLAWIGLALILAGSSGAAAHAAEGGFTASGNALDIDAPCATHLSIMPDPALNGAIRVAATASHQEEIDRLSVGTEAGSAVVRLDRRYRECWKPDDDRSWSPTLALAIRVPPGMPLSIDESGSAAYTIGAVGGMLSADLSGAVTLDAARVAALDLDLSGTTGISIDAVAGTVALRTSGRSLVRLARVEAPSFQADLSGSDDLAVEGGTIGTFALEGSGMDRVAIGGTTGNAQVSLSGAGDVRIARLTGTLAREISGVATLEVGR